MADMSGNGGKFKQALDKLNRLERACGGPAKDTRYAVDGEAAQRGLGALETQSKGRPNQADTTQMRRP